MTRLSRNKKKNGCENIEDYSHLYTPFKESERTAPGTENCKIYIEYIIKKHCGLVYLCS